jgi:ankyrin repeat protein
MDAGPKQAATDTTLIYSQNNRPNLKAPAAEPAPQNDPPGRARSKGAAGETALIAAVETPETLRLLLNAGADPNEADAAHRTALMMAARLDRIEAAQHLLDGGADPERVTIAWTADGPDAMPMQDSAVAAGATALMMAAANAQPPLIRLLIDHGAQPRDRDANNRTACDYLARNETLQPPDRAAVKPLLCP